MICDFCGKEASFIYICADCRGRNCKKHRFPKDHECAQLMKEKSLKGITNRANIQVINESKPKVIHENLLNPPEKENKSNENQHTLKENSLSRWIKNLFVREKV
jgi:hypothetical protein